MQLRRVVPSLDLNHVTTGNLTGNGDTQQSVHSPTYTLTFSPRGRSLRAGSFNFSSNAVPPLEKLFLGEDLSSKFPAEERATYLSRYPYGYADHVIRVEPSFDAAEVGYVPTGHMITVANHQG
jgi:hypothetical protein